MTSVKLLTNFVVLEELGLAKTQSANIVFQRQVEMMYLVGSVRNAGDLEDVENVR